MKDFTGDPEFPIWLMGDSPPEAWMDKLDTPLDPRHPARHNIWTSVADIIQDKLYRQRKLRLDTSRLYIRNVMNKPLNKPITNKQMHLVQNELRRLFNKHKPIIVLTFGVAAFAMSTEAAGDIPPVFAKSARRLGEQFRSCINNFSDDKVNIMPLLHVSIARGKFLSAHRNFVDTYWHEPPNYFDYVGTKIADLLLTKLSDKPIWIK